MQAFPRCFAAPLPALNSPLIDFEVSNTKHIHCLPAPKSSAELSDRRDANSKDDKSVSQGKVKYRTLTIDIKHERRRLRLMKNAKASHDHSHNISCDNVQLLFTRYSCP